MDIVELLAKERDEVLAEATDGLRRSHLEHYEKAGLEESRKRLETLYDLVLEGIKARSALRTIRHIKSVAQERFDSGFDLREVQTALNVLEEAIWVRVLKKLPTDEIMGGLGKVSTIFGIAKDVLGRSYVALATRRSATSFDLNAFFDGV